MQNSFCLINELLVHFARK